MTPLRTCDRLRHQVGMLADEVPRGVSPDDRCGVLLTGRRKALAVRWRNLQCRCARCVTGVQNEGRPSDPNKGRPADPNKGRPSDPNKGRPSDPAASPVAHWELLSADDMLLELHGHELDSRAKVQGDLGPEPRTMHHQPKDVPQVLLSRLMATADARPGGQQLHVPMQRMRERDS